MCDNYRPVLQLRLGGLCCPCLSTDEDRARRVAELSLKTVPIRWYRMIRTLRPPPSAQNERGRGGCLTCGAGGGGGGDDMEDDYGEDDGDGDEDAVGLNPLKNSLLSRQHHSPRVLTSCYVGVDATLDVFDSPSGPAIYVTSGQFDFVDDDISAADDRFNDSRRAAKDDKPAVMKKVVPLVDVGNVATAFDSDGTGEEDRRSVAASAAGGTIATWTDDLQIDGIPKCGVVVTGIPRHESPTDVPRKLLVFEVREDEMATMTQGAQQKHLTRDNVINHLNTLLSWNRERVAAIEAKKRKGTKKKKRSSVDVIESSRMGGGGTTNEMLERQESLVTLKRGYAPSIQPYEHGRVERSISSNAEAAADTNCCSCAATLQLDKK